MKTGKPKKLFTVAICDCTRRNFVTAIKDAYGKLALNGAWQCQDCYLPLTDEQIEKK